MSKVLRIAGLGLLQVVRDRRALALMLGMPVILIGILGSALGGMFEEGGIPPFTVLIVNDDRPVTSPVPLDLGKVLVEEVLGGVKVKEIVTLEPTSDLEAARSQVSKGAAAAVIHVPPSLTADVMAGKQVKIHVYTDPGRPTQAAILEQIIGSFTEAITAGMLSTQTLGPGAGTTALLTPVISDGASGVKPVNAIQYYGAAMAAMFMVMNALGRAKVIVDERGNGTLSRILVSPTAAAQILTGQMLGTTAVLYAQFLVLVFGTHLLFGVYWGEWLPVLILGGAFALATAGIGTAVAGSMNDPQVVDGYIGVIGNLFAALSGAMVPLYSFPKALLYVAKVIPNYWALQGFLDQMGGLGLQSLWLPVTVLIGMGLVTGTYGTWRMSTETMAR